MGSVGGGRLRWLFDMPHHLVSVFLDSIKADEERDNYDRCTQS